MRLRRRLDRWARHFEPGRPLEKLAPLFEMVDTLLYTPGTVTRTGPQVRDALDLKRAMTIVVVALVPCLFMATYNTGYQAHVAIAAGAPPLDDGATAVFRYLGLSLGEPTLAGSIALGSLYFLPVLAICLAAGGAMEVLFSVVRRHPVSEGFFVTGFLIPLTLPATIPLWQVALGTAFGVVVGKEIFGGTGMNFLNPALVARAFLFFAYPAEISGNVWTAAGAVDATTGATPLARVAESTTGDPAVGFLDAFLGLVPGSMGETSTLACLLGAGVLLGTGVASWRTMLGVLLGSVLLLAFLSALDADASGMLLLPLHLHLALGGWAFGTVFMATDPVSSAFTRTGQLAYGFGIGALAMLVRIFNPAYPEGMMLAILFMNLFAPAIDHLVVRANVRRRKARYAAR